jgi:hypothetical protein
VPGLAGDEGILPVDYRATRQGPKAIYYLRALRKASRQLRSFSPLPLADLVYTPGDPLCGLCFASAVGRVRLAWRLLA